MRTVGTEQLACWITEGTLLECDGRGPKVVQCRDGRILKIFYTRRARPLARLFPAARRFARNAQLLQHLGIPVPVVNDVFWLDKARGLSACRYEPLPGCPLEHLQAQHPDRIRSLIPALARFIAHLHGKRIYFRSLHLGNILLLEDGRFGLIDILDLRHKTFPLSHWHIRRNFRHLERSLQRREHAHFPLADLQAEYWKQRA